MQPPYICMYLTISKYCCIYVLCAPFIPKDLIISICINTYTYLQKVYVLTFSLDLTSPLHPWFLSDSIAYAGSRSHETPHITPTAALPFRPILLYIYMYISVYIYAYIYLICMKFCIRPRPQPCHFVLLN
jgi:hypothetical protein